MNEVFEKILEMFDAKKQYFQKFYETDGKTEEDEYINNATQLAFDDAKEIVQKVAEEYNGGWIPVSERLPEENSAVLVWCPERKDIYCAYLEEGQWWIFGAYFEKVKLEVIAWMPLPEPFKERD